MRLVPIALAVALCAGATVAATPASLAPVGQVHVSIGPALQAKAREYGQRDLDGLAQDLRKSVETALSRKGRLDRAGGTLDLVITDATPNRPTFAQLAAKPGLSMRSISIGGASIEGTETLAGGAPRHLSYSW